MDKLMRILKNLRPEVDFSKVDNLVDEEILDSFDMVALVTEIAEEFDIQVGIENLTPENFNSVEAIMNLINKLQEE